MAFNYPYALARCAYRQTRNIGRLMAGLPVRTPPLIASTVGEDDAELAIRWLKDRRQWNEEGIVREYEKAFAQWNGSKRAFSFMGGRIALSASISALGLKPGDEVIVPGYTCVVVANALIFAGIQPVFCDIELDTYGLDVSRIEGKMSAATKAILIHHLYGLVCRDYEKLLSLASSRGIPIIEDCAQSTGATFKGIKVGNRGSCGFYSSEHSKIFSTVQGGMAVTGDEQLAIKLEEFQRKAPFPNEKRTEDLLWSMVLDFRRYCDPSRWWRTEVEEMAHGRRPLESTTSAEIQGLRPVNWGERMPAPIAALGLNQLKKIDRFNEARRGAAPQWDSWCNKTGNNKPLVIAESKPVFLRYPVMVKPGQKTSHSWTLRALGIEAGVWFISNLHPSHRNIEGCPAANEAVHRCINLPCPIR